MSENAEASRNARRRQQAEHRVIVQATMQAKRAGKLPRVHNGGSEVLTAIAVVLIVSVTLFLAFRYGN